MTSSLLYVSFFIVAITVLMVSITRYVTIKKSFFTKNIIARQMKKISNGLDNYIGSLSESDRDVYPYEVPIQELADKDFISAQYDLSSFLPSHESSYIIKLINDNKNVSRLAGVTFLCDKSLKSEKYSISHALGFSGGVLRNFGSDTSKVFGAAGGWVLDPAEYKTLFSNKLLENPDNCVFNLTGYMPVNNKSNQIDKPVLADGDIVVMGMSDGQQKAIFDSAWQPLFKDDALVITNNSPFKSLYMEIVSGADDSIMMQSYLNQHTNYVYITKAFIGNSIKINIYPLDPAGNKGNAITIPPNDGLINIENYSDSIWNKLDFYVQANLYNSDMSIPKKPLNGTRSDIGLCADDASKDKEKNKTGSKDKDKTTDKVSAGFDIEGLFFDMKTSHSGAGYLSSHNIKFNLNDHTILDLVISNPSQLSSGKIFWGTNDIRNSHSPLIPGMNVKYNGFYLLTDSCKKKDSFDLKASISVDEKFYSNVLAQKWTGDKPLWDLTTVHP
ncbi:hypothetical protein BL250_14990 [Erwinia sp. OLTSP20]|uniref:hypothetical protein n=1 Tax=Erwinia sp. OLTSP20 TaxID=1912857 RepID=UPI000C1758EA|nr:hypothetical protein [Erwinia sp. OLTSP20]PIJ89832.1 hypothetical protein BL250_14990 [Erwinia sp. OLTSP20]